MRQPKIKSVALLYKNQPARRKIKVMLTNGTRIYIERLYESWQQYGGTIDELRVTVPMAERFNKWLHGQN